MCVCLCGCVCVSMSACMWVRVREGERERSDNGFLHLWQLSTLSGGFLQRAIEFCYKRKKY